MSLDEALGIGDLEKLTINITEQKLTAEQLENYRQGRLQGALAQ